MPRVVTCEIESEPCIVDVISVFVREDSSNNIAHLMNILLYIWKLGAQILLTFYSIVAHDKHSDEY